MASLESVLGELVDEAIDHVDVLSQGPWIDDGVRRRLKTLKMALDEALAEFNHVNDGGPTEEDIEGSVQHG